VSATTLAFKISKEAMKLVKAGKAVISSGGVRDLAGQFIELAKPVSKLSQFAASLNPVMAGVNVVSSLATNVQCAFIQKGVDAANKKLDDVLLQLNQMSKALGGLQTIQALSWVNTAFSLANCGVSIAGFYMTLTKLNGISDQLKEFYDRYREDRQRDKVMHFSEIMNNLKSDLGMLMNRAQNDTFTEEDFKNADPAVTRLINEAKAFIEIIIEEFEKGVIDGKVACQIIFTLSAVLSQTIGEFCSQYYYVHHIRHHMYDEWVSYLDKIDCDEFRTALKQHLQTDNEYVEISPVQKSAAVMMAFEGIREEKNRLSVCDTMITKISEQEYFCLEQTITERLYLELPQLIPELEKVDMDALLTERIMKMEEIPSGDDAQVMIDVL